MLCLDVDRARVRINVRVSVRVECNYSLRERGVHRARVSVRVLGNYINRGVHTVRV